jgi:hypothetical protein
MARYGEVLVGTRVGKAAWRNVLCMQDRLQQRVGNMQS